MLSSSSSSAAAQSMTGGRVAVVTGANKGIGYFIALQLGLSGLFEHIVLGCRSASLGQAAVASLQSQFDSSSASTTTKAKATYLPLTIGDHASHVAFQKELSGTGGRVDLLVNNAGTAFKGSDPTPFAQQTKPTLDVNFRGTVDFTEQILPLLRETAKKTGDGRIVNVASMSGHLSQVSSELQTKFTSPTLTMPELDSLMDQFEADVQAGNHRKQGWSNSNYGMSKLALIAATKVWAREEAANNITVNCICPGYCDTDMTSHKGPRPPEDGAKVAVLPATMNNPPTGAFFADMKEREW